MRVRIGEVAAATGATTKTLRFYEQSGLLQPAERTPSGYRRYGSDAVERLHFIRRSQAAGLTLAEIRTILEIRDAGDAPCAHVERLLADRLKEIDRQITELRQLRVTVAGLHRAATEAEPDSCAPETICRYLERTPAASGDRWTSRPVAGEQDAVNIELMAVLDRPAELTESAN